MIFARLYIWRGRFWTVTHKSLKVWKDSQKSLKTSAVAQLIGLKWPRLQKLLKERFGTLAVTSRAPLGRGELGTKMSHFFRGGKKWDV